jgi:polar amino acid transport system permease protein
MTNFTWDFTPLLQNYPVLLKGVGMTALLWTIAFPSAMVLGLLISMATGSRGKVLAWVGRVYVEVFRNTPVIIQLIWFFYAFPILTGLQLTPIVAALSGLILNGSAYCSEIFRGGVGSIPKGQWEGARALGMSHAQVLRRVILPQVFSRMLPAFTNRGIELAKNTSIASVITVQELMYQGRALSSTSYRPLEVLTGIAVIYFLLIYPGSFLASRLERRFAARTA